ncbi:MAG: hypothetical protein KG075_23035 [Alphaproteobacteria bacterium]|nr:hypothetical protein [Alphaproteobacteria bacterium]
MNKLIWIVAGFALLVWSGLAWLGHGLLEWATAFASSNADQLTLGSEFSGLLVWLAGLLDGAGGFIIAVIWLVVSAAIVAVAAILSRLLGQRSSPQTPGQYLPYSRR